MTREARREPAYVAWAACMRREHILLTHSNAWKFSGKCRIVWRPACDQPFTDKRIRCDDWRRRMHYKRTGRLMRLRPSAMIQVLLRFFRETYTLIEY